MPELGENTRAFEIEQRGIEHVTEGERHGTPRELFWMWFGTLSNVLAVVTGAVIISVGISFVQAIFVIVIGNVLACASLGIASLQGPEAGTTTMVVSRAAFGPRGGRVLSGFNWLTVVGFEASGVALIALAALAILGQMGVASSTGVKIAVVIAAIAIQGVLPMFGHAAIVLSLRYLSYLFAPLFVVMAVVVVPKVHLAALSKGGTWGEIMVALAITIAGGGLSFANIGSDYTRYLPRLTSKRALFGAVTVGSLIPIVLLELLGAAIQSVAPASDPISGLPKVLGSGVLVPYLVFAMITLFAVNTTDLYSSGLTLQSIGLRLTRWKCVIVDLIVCAAVAAVTLFSTSFNTLFSDFLSLLILWLAPWFGIYAVDWLLRKQEYDPEALLNDSGGAYWYRRGYNPAGMVALLVGMGASALWINTPVFQGPLSHLTGNSDFSVFTGVFAGGLVYWRAQHLGSRSRESAASKDEARLPASADPAASFREA